MSLYHTFSVSLSKWIWINVKHIHIVIFVRPRDCDLQHFHTVVYDTVNMLIVLGVSFYVGIQECTPSIKWQCSKSGLISDRHHNSRRKNLGHILIQIYLMSIWKLIFKIIKVFRYLALWGFTFSWLFINIKTQIRK